MIRTESPLLKHLLALVSVSLLLLVQVPAQAGDALPVSAGAAVEAPQNPTGESDGHAAQDHKSLADTQDAEFFTRNFSHLIPHAMTKGEQGPLTFYNNNLFQAIAVILVLLIFSMVKNSFSGGAPSGPIRVFRSWCHWLRDEVVYSIMGKEEGRAFAPYFLYLFFFIAFMNLLGLVPVVGHTATASFYVTGALAGITFFMMLFFGIRKQGVVGYFVNLLPHGLPVALIPLMAVVELAGMMIKPFALMVRLFANMLGGHMVVYAFLGMIFLFAKMMEGNVGLSIATAIPAVGLSVFINIIEGFIALLQAYVFTYLSVIFVQQAVHPAH